MLDFIQKERSILEYQTSTFDNDFSEESKPIEPVTRVTQE
jgi:hypothetical protein